MVTVLVVEESRVGPTCSFGIARHLGDLYTAHHRLTGHELASSYPHHGLHSDKIPLQQPLVPTQKSDSKGLADVISRRPAKLSLLFLLPRYTYAYSRAAIVALDVGSAATIIDGD